MPLTNCTRPQFLLLCNRYETDTVKQYEETRLKNVNGKVVAIKVGKNYIKHPDGSTGITAYVGTYIVVFASQSMGS